jgi:protein MpaA
MTAPATAAPATSVVLTEGPLAVFDFAATQLAVGTSIEGRLITADRYGTPGGRRVLVIGVIHGDEDAGVAIIDELRERVVPDGVELWVIESMNPDGQASQDRQNANGVDLNRNFPHKWGVIGEPGNSQYAGMGPASEPETQAMVNLITQLRPDIAIWYHQDANLIIPSTGRDGQIRARYAELAALPLADCCGGGGVYTGIAASWAKNELQKDSDAVAFIVELPGGDLSTQQVNAHANAVLTIGIEG